MVFGEEDFLGKQQAVLCKLSLKAFQIFWLQNCFILLRFSSSRSIISFNQIINLQNLLYKLYNTFLLLICLQNSSFQLASTNNNFYPMQEDKLPLPMQKGPRKLSLSSSTWKREDLLNSDQNIQSKTYRMFMHHCFESINSFYAKKTKSCLPEIDELYKIPLSKEQKYFLEENIYTIYDYHSDKLKRQMLARNSQASKQLAEYHDTYFKYHGNEPKKEQYLRPSSEVHFCRKVLTTQKSSKDSVKFTKKVLPYPIRNHEKQSKQLLPIDKDSLCERKQIIDYFHMNSKLNKAKNEQFNNTSFTQSVSKFLDKSTQEPSKSFEDRQRLKYRFILLNTTLATSIGQTQTYKPKSKCWGTNLKYRISF